MPLKDLLERRGLYIGEGKNHEDEPFRGHFLLAPILGGRGVDIRFTAEGKDGTLYHSERTLIAPLPDGTLGLFCLTTNTTGLLQHREVACEAPEGSARSLCFQHGELEDRAIFREQVTLDLFENGDIGYRFAWGLPEGDFAPRSAARLIRQRGPQPRSPSSP